MDQTPWLDDRAADSWLELVTVMELLRAALDSQMLSDANLTFFEFVTMAQLAEAPGREMRLTDLAVGTNSSLPRISRVVARLERDGYLDRRVNESDGRSRVVYLTPEGWEKFRAASPEHIRLVHHVFVEALEPEQFDQLRDICRAIIGTLDPALQVFASARGGRIGRPGLSRLPDADAPDGS